jgi:hypothetical protein
MTKRLFAILTLIIIVMLIVIIILRNRSERLGANQQKDNVMNSQKKTNIVINSDKLEINGRKVIGLPAGKEKQFIQQIKISNAPSEEWKVGLERTLKAQGGESIKDLKLEKVDSFVWVQDDIALFAESVLVQVKNEKNVNIKFRVLVDAQTGKILNNWDRPVIDLYDPKSDFKIPIDPRYHAE